MGNVGYGYPVDGETRSRNEKRRLASGDGELQESLAGLSRLAAGHLALEDMLTQVATLAAVAVPRADAVGLTLSEQHRPDIIVASAPLAAEVNKVQYGLGQGPCISAAAASTTVISASLGADRRWLQFGSKTARMGVHSALSLPLSTPVGVVGSLNLYARAKGAFDGRDAERGQTFATPAAVAVQNAQVLAQSRRLTQELQSALTSRAVIDRAIGIVLSRTGGSAEEAFTILRKLSQNGHQKLHEVAQRIVDDAIRRAESRQRR